MAHRGEDLKARLLATFRVEAEEHLQAITANFLALARGLPPTEARGVLEATFREVHTLKGAARSVSLLEVEALCQACESALSRVTRGRLTFGRAMLSCLQEAIDGVARLVAGNESPGAVRTLIDSLERAAPEPAAEVIEPVEAPSPRQPEPPGPIGAGLPQADTIRLATAKLDALFVHAEDFLALKLAAAERVQEAGTLHEALAGHRADPELRSLAARARELLGHLVRDQRAISGTVDRLQEEMRQIRMTPVATILDLFPRMAGELARAQGKDVDWETRGADLEVDRKVLQAIKEPLIHLVRNAIDHGIEPPDARAQAGKPRQGKVAATVAALEGNRIEIRVEDDGRGIDVAQVKAEAVRSRLLSPEDAQGLTGEEALDLIYRSGFSTSPIITDVSGHGLGLAIVKERVEHLGGVIRVETRSGAGTSVRMILPAAIATFRGLLVRAAGQPFLLPSEAVERAIRIAPEEIEHVEGQAAIRRNGSPLAIARLSALLRLPEQAGETAPGKCPCVVMRTGEDRVGLLVDEIRGDREVLIKELTAPLLRLRNVASAGLLGTGRVVLILRPADLLRAAREAPRPAPAPAAPEKDDRQKAVLVVDDSITTRTMEKNLLESAGYRVRVAVDGIEAWTLLKSETFDLVVSDVDMPRLDGFDLTARIRADRKLAELPVVLVTALESREDKERGVEVGASAYLIKSSFDQSNLLEIIHRLV